MAKGPDWNDIHRTNPGAVRDALTESDIPFDEPPREHSTNGARGRRKRQVHEKLNGQGQETERTLPPPGS
jgi:hypothetical protein